MKLKSIKIDLVAVVGINLMIDISHNYFVVILIQLKS